MREIRNEYDFLKAVTILLVVVGHITNKIDSPMTNLFSKALYIFHMSLFVAISGAVYALGCDRGKYVSCLPFLTNKCLRLGVPFLASAFLFLAPTLVCLGLSDLSYLATVFNIVKGGEYVKHLWYLQSLFWMFAAAWMIKKIGLNLYVTFFSTVLLGVVCSEFNLRIGCLGLDMAIEKLPMFVLGMIFIQGKKFSDRNVLLCSGVAGCIFATWQKFCDVHIVDNILRFLLSASIVVFIQPLARIAFSRMRKSTLLAFVLKQSFGIYLFYMSFIYLIISKWRDTWPLSLSILLIFTIALCGSIVVTIGIRKVKLGVLIGER